MTKMKRMAKMKKDGQEDDWAFFLLTQVKLPDRSLQSFQLMKSCLLHCHFPVIITIDLALHATISSGDFFVYLQNTIKSIANTDWKSAISKAEMSTQNLKKKFCTALPMKLWWTWNFQDAHIQSSRPARQWMVGLKSVKTRVQEIATLLLVDRARQTLGLTSVDSVYTCASQVTLARVRSR